MPKFLLSLFQEFPYTFLPGIQYLIFELNIMFLNPTKAFLVIFTLHFVL